MRRVTSRPRLEGVSLFSGILPASVYYETFMCTRRPRPRNAVLANHTVDKKPCTRLPYSYHHNLSRLLESSTCDSLRDDAPWIVRLRVVRDAQEKEKVGVAQT